MSAKRENRTEHSSTSSTPMLLELMIELPLLLLDQKDIYTDRPQGSDASIGGPVQATACRIENLWQQHASAGVSKETLELLLTGWSKGTNTAYQLGRKRCSGWYQGREASPISCGVQPFLDFITSLFQEGLQY